MAGKGDRPRNNWGKNWRKNYDQMKKGKGWGTPMFHPKPPALPPECLVKQLSSGIVG